MSSTSSGCVAMVPVGWDSGPGEVRVANMRGDAWGGLNLEKAVLSCVSARIFRSLACFLAFRKARRLLSNSFANFWASTWTFKMDLHS